ncbi:hypothetical protein FRC09_007548 [Ceratobasidium sp. 395]|nr:hypothetical protein FRC09_007548 [Ceratobasidium sp. 395]
MNSPIKIEFPKQHHTLSRVCARWQQVVTSASALWSRIDLAVSGKYKEAFYVRASHFVFRAGNAPLMIRIHEPTPPKSSDIERLMNWLAPVAGRVYSLDVLEGITTSSMVNDILNTWLKLGVPGTINELALSAGASGIYFLEPAPGSGSSSGSDSAQWKYDISLEAFESFFRPITTLRLTGVFPQWDSHAYHGLNHLHLDKGPITENQLVAVLSSSPYLCTLSFGLTVTGTAPAGTRKGPIYLRDLNILNL